MTFVALEGLAILSLILASLALRSFVNSWIEAARVKAQTSMIVATHFRSAVLTLRSSPYQCIAGHLSFILSLLVLALPLNGTATPAILAALSMVWLLALTSLIFEEHKGRSNIRIARLYVLVVGILFTCSVAIESSSAIKIICIALIYLLVREVKLNRLSTNLLGSGERRMDLPLHFAQFSTSLLLYIVFFQEILLAGAFIIYLVAIVGESISSMFVNGLFALPNLKRSQDNRNAASAVTVLVLIIALIAMKMIGATS